MIEEYLVNYGVLGIWTLSLLIERYRTMNKLNQVIDNNTIALTRVYETINKCKAVKGGKNG